MTCRSNYQVLVKAPGSHIDSLLAVCNTRMPTLRDAYLRYSRHYGSVLRLINDFYMRGGEAAGRGLALFDLNWANINAAYDWSERHSYIDKDAAWLCAYIPHVGADVLDLRQNLFQRIHWLEAALKAVKLFKLDRRLECLHLSNLGTVYVQLGQPRRAIEYFEQTLTIARELGELSIEGVAFGNLGNAYSNLGDMSSALAYYNQDLAVCRQTKDRRGEGRAWLNLGSIYSHRNDFHSAVACYQEALTAAREACDRLNEGNALGNIGITYRHLGELELAIEYYEHALQISRELGDLRGEGTASGNLGVAYADLGEYFTALNYYDQQLKVSITSHDHRGQAAALYNSSLALYKLGLKEQAIAQAKTAMVIFEQIEDLLALQKTRDKLASWQRQH